MLIKNLTDKEIGLNSIDPRYVFLFDPYEVRDLGDNVIDKQDLAFQIKKQRFILLPIIEISRFELMDLE